MGRSERSGFPGRINRRLSLLFGVLFCVVLLVGGISLYLSRSIFLGAEEIRRESEQIDVADRIHSTIHHFLSALQRARILRTPIADSERQAYLQELTTLLESERYHEAEDERKVVGGIRQIVTDLASFSEKLAKEIHQPGMTLDPRELEALGDAELKIQGLAHRLSATHRAKMEKTLGENGLRMQLIVALYAAFVFVGAILIMGSSVVFYRAIAQPLRSLAQAAGEIAEGDLHKQVPIVSKDEIGQLSHAFNIMTARLREHQERLKGLATLEERERLARELHDSLAQNLAALHLKIIEAGQTLRTDGATEARETLEEMRKIAEGAYEDVRQAIFGLRTMVSKGLGLLPTLIEYLHDFSELRKIPVDLKIHGTTEIRFSPQVEIQLIRIIHEALTNVSKHAQASRGAVRFERDGKFARVTVEDNGKGFLPEEAMGKGFHFGLQTMKERAEGVGGKLTVESAPGKGTKVVVLLPFEGEAHETQTAPAR